MSQWDIIANTYNICLSSLLFIMALITFYISFKGFKSKNRYGGSSTFICGIFFTFFGLYNLLFWLFLYPFNGFMVWWMGILVGVYLIFALVVRKILRNIESKKKNSTIVDKENENKSRIRKYVELMTKENQYRKEIPIKMELARKSFHLLGLLFVIGYFGFVFIPPLVRIVNDLIIEFIHLVEWTYNILWGDVYQQYPYIKGEVKAVRDIALFALIGALMIMLLSDFIRILMGPEYSFFNLITKPILRNKDLNAISPAIYLITGIIFTYILFLDGYFHILVITASVLISCLSDAAAALIGRMYGKHKVRCIGGDIKSVEGFIAGTASAYLIGLICVGPIYALVGAIIFFLLDYFPTLIADNILNPLLIPIGMQLFSILLGFPIGWF
jgi:dolichol kinase